MRRALVALGVLVMAFAVAGALTDHDVRRFGVLVFLVGVLLWHDLLVMPLVIVVASLIGRAARRVAGRVARRPRRKQSARPRVRSGR